MSHLNPIEAAVMPLKTDAMDRAEKYARESVIAMTAKLEANGMNLAVVAPYPSSFGMGRTQYQIAKGKRHAFDSFTKGIDDLHLPYFQRQHTDSKTTYIVQVVPAAIERIVELNRANAAAQYDSFVAKLNQKCGTVVSATLKGSHVWDTSILTVTKADGSVQRWKTTMILNRSVHGKLFNQFPTRLLKEAT